MRISDIFLNFLVAILGFTTATMAVTVGIDGYYDDWDQLTGIGIYLISMFYSFLAIREVRKG